MEGPPVHFTFGRVLAPDDRPFWRHAFCFLKETDTETTAYKFPSSSMSRPWGASVGSSSTISAMIRPSLSRTVMRA